MDAFFNLPQDVVVGNELLEGDHVTFVSYYQQGGRRRASNVRATRSDGPGGRSPSRFEGDHRRGPPPRDCQQY